MSTRFVRTALQTGIPFGVFMSLYQTLASDGSLVRGLVSGAFAGVLFGLLMAAFSEFGHRRSARYDPSGPEEELLRWEAARRGKGRAAASGYLYLTDERLVFLPRDFSLPDDEISIALGKIDSVLPRRTGGVLPNGLEIVWGEGSEHFVVQDRKGWIRQLRRRLSGSAG